MKILFVKFFYYSYRIAWSAAYYLYARTIKTQGRLEVWTRNSFLLKYDRAFKSDIDITILSNRCSSNKLQKIKKINDVFRFFFPFLGESNFYFSQETQEISKFFNIYELKRDPILYAKIEEVSNPDLYQKIIFLVRHLENDRVNIKKQFYSKKWAFYFQHIEAEYDASISVRENIFTLLSALLSAINIPISKTFIQAVIDTNFSFLFHSEFEKEFLILMPHRWLGQALCERKLETKLGFHKKILSQSELCLIEQALCWELTGIYSQMYLNYASTIPDHLKNLRNLAETLHLHKLTKGFSFLESLVKEKHP